MFFDKADAYHIGGIDYAFGEKISVPIKFFQDHADDNFVCYLTEDSKNRQPAGDLKQQDLAYGSAILVSEGQNSNGAYFLRDQLIKASNTPILKPVNIEHHQDVIIGVIYDSAIVSQANNKIFEKSNIQSMMGEEDMQDEEKMRRTQERMHNANSGMYKILDDMGNEVKDKIDIRTNFAIYKYLYPEVASEIAKFQNGMLNNKYFVSMEVFYNEFGYVFNDDVETFTYVPRDMTGAVLYDKYEPWVNKEMPDGRKVAKAYMNFVFGGMGITQNPANKRSYLLTLANKAKNSDKSNSKVNALVVDNSVEGTDFSSKHSGNEFEFSQEDAMGLTPEQKDAIQIAVNQAMASSPGLDESAARMRVLEERIFNLEKENTGLASKVETNGDVIAALEQKKEALATELATTEADLSGKLSEREARIAALETTLSETAAALAEIKQREVGFARISELETLGIKFGTRKDAVFARISKMTDEEYSAYKEDMVSVIEAKASEEVPVAPAAPVDATPAVPAEPVVPTEPAAEETAAPDLSTDNDTAKAFAIATASVAKPTQLDEAFIKDVFATITTRSKDHKRGNSVGIE